MPYFSIILLLWILGLNHVQAQTPVQFSPGILPQVQIQQAPVDTSAPEEIEVKPSFDRSAVRPGDTFFYRVAVSAKQDILAWPDTPPASPELKFGPNFTGQMARMEGNKFRPLTMIVYEVKADAAGHFVISNFSLACGNQTVNVPAVAIDCSQTITNENNLPRLLLQVSETNLYVGQPFRLRLAMPAGPGNRIEALREVQINGGGIITDKTALRQMVETVPTENGLRPAFIYEVIATPIAVGQLEITGQAFTAGSDFGGPVVIRGQVTLPGGPPNYVLQISAPLTLHVRPLPEQSQPPGYTGSMGKFLADLPQLATNRIRVGEPVHLKFGFHGLGDLTRFVPPIMPRLRDWQIVADNPPGTGCTLIPLTDDMTNTPAIPFCTFDPVSGRFTDQSIPSLPVTVFGDGLPQQLPEWNADDQSHAPVKLSGPATSPGKTVGTLRPLQLQGWFVLLQIAPLLGLFALWRWDERRRFWEAHPELVRRRQARRALRKARKAMNQAAQTGDATGFIHHAAAALRIVVAPHFPAEPQALVGADVLSQLDERERNGEAGRIVRTIFQAADTVYASEQPATTEWRKMSVAVETVLQQLEAKL